MAKIAFIGLGNMGQPMATCLVKAGHEVAVFDLVESAMQALEAEGATAARSASDAVDGAEYVISMLPAGQHVEHLYLGVEGLLAQLPAGTMVIDSSTIDAMTARKVGEAAQGQGITFVDAPVSGGIGGAKAGTLTFIVGGATSAFEQVKDVLEPMARHVFHAGELGAGQVAKACNNMLLAVLMAGTTEALALGVKNGLDPAVLSNIMQQSSGGNWVLNGYNPWPGVMPDAPASHHYQGGFQVDLMLKDLGLATDIATASHAAMPMGALARNLYALHAQGGHGKRDFSSLQSFFTVSE